MSAAGALKSTADRADMEHIGQEAFWRRQFPGLSIGERLARGDLPQLQPSTTATQVWFERMREEGYFQGTVDVLASFAPKLADAVKTCRALEIPPVFIFLFDETWLCFHALHPLLGLFLGKSYRILPDFWTWHVDPRHGESGWNPHRDKGRMSLNQDGTPASLTVWIPLTESAPQNGCMYLLPANRDPTYNTENERTWQINFAKIRALPASPGDFLCWNQAVLHWGGESSRFATEPRISMALEFQSGERAPFNQPLLPALVNLSFDLRMALIAKQILQYKHMYPLSERVRALAQRIMMTHTQSQPDVT